MRINKKITILSLKRISIRQEQGTSILPDQSLGNIFVQIQTLGISQSILVFNFLSNKNLFDSDLNFLAIDGVWNIWYRKNESRHVASRETCPEKQKLLLTN